MDQDLLHAGGLTTLELEAVKAEKVRSIEKLYVLRDPTRVRGFIRQHAFLTDLLEQARVAIQKYFGADHKVLLEVVADPEVPGLVEMFGYIVSGLSPEEAAERLQQFDQGWFLKQLPRAKGLLNFDVEFA